MLKDHTNTVPPPPPYTVAPTRRPTVLIRPAPPRPAASTHLKPRGWPAAARGGWR